MPSNKSLGRFRFACVCLLVAAAPAWSQETERRATLVVRLPADARLVIDGQQTKQTGSERHFYSPPLAPGKSYHYTLEWSYRKDGKPVMRTKVVHVRAGDEIDVDLRKDEAGDEAKPKKNPDEPEKKKEKTKKPEREPDVVFVPTPQEVVDKMLELAAVKKEDVVYDLGCGDGIIVVTAAKKYGCKAFGFDIDPVRIKESRDRVKTAGVQELVTIEKKDIFKLDLSPASVVTLYLLPELNVKLIPQLEKLKPGSRIVSHEFAMKGVKPKQMVKVEAKEDGQMHTVYLWVTPLQKE
jgi:uncharacterized protein (TIGR03000 family)